jgi:hypothetical protein
MSESVRQRHMGLVGRVPSLSKEFRMIVEDSKKIVSEVKKALH